MKLKGGKKKRLIFPYQNFAGRLYTYTYIYIYNLLSTNMSSSLIEIYQLTYLPKLFQT